MSNNSEDLSNDEEIFIKTPNIERSQKKRTRKKKLPNLPINKPEVTQPLSNEIIVEESVFTISTPSTQPTNEIFKENKPNIIEINGDFLFKGTCFCIRDRRIHLRSTHFFEFKIEEQENPIFLAKTHGFLGNTVYIGKYPNFHIKSNEFQYVMDINFKKDTFILHQNNIEGPELNEISINNNYGEENGPRIFNIKTLNNQWKSKIATKNKRGKWTLNFHGQFTISSCKNAIILDEEFNPIIHIRKIEKNILELKTFKEIPLHILFSLGISSYLYPN